MVATACDPAVSCEGNVVTHTYFSDREYGPQPQDEQEFSPGAWGGVIALVTARIESGAFGIDFPEQCPDGRGTVGTDSESFWLALHAEVPAMAGTINRDNVPPAPAIMDLLEFCYHHVAQPIHGHYHGFFSHHHLSFDRDQGQLAFREAANRILARNGLAYELRDDGMAVHLAPPVLREALALAVFKTGDAELDTMLESARARFLSPDLQQRRESLEKLWDAWERVKTLEPGKDKRESAGLILDLAAPEEPFRSVLEEEARQLTSIGNDFQIRHSETDKTPVTLSEHIDYLFHRLFCMIQLLLRRRRSLSPEAGYDATGSG
ncbi:hypothetical protein LCGC14_1759340 [marine sediment metagenome]|uniref:Uncharacterized protein n=1 Tax=marine sediment metagenome TaxID=412755 RepID=A0A0F9K162_9ZZZZ